MRLIQFADGTYQESSELLKMFGLESRRNPVISVVGAGGKTSLIKALADDYTKDHRSVIVTTTTHMMQPEFSMFTTSQSTEQQEQKILPTSQSTEQQGQKIFLTDQTPDWRQQMNCRNRQQIWLGVPTDAGKIKNPFEEMWEAAFARRIPILIEADGAKRKSCKAPAEHEPVIRPETTAV
ncbi:MAG: hypothetical protein Q4G60_14380, partial [bacterium]|nr:hypothetical protein [bacterium]